MLWEAMGKGLWFVWCQRFESGPWSLALGVLGVYGVGLAGIMCFPPQPAPFTAQLAVLGCFKKPLQVRSR
jgi:hypothetical protein